MPVPLTPPVLPPSDQVWHTYAPVRAASTEGVVALLTRPEVWPDFATELGRFTPLRPGGLAGQTFEIEIMTPFAPRFPAYTRGYVTITRLETADEPAGLREWVDTLNEAMVRIGRDEPAVVPDGATPLAGFDITTHEGHFMGSARNRLVLYEHEGASWLRAAGTWDEMPFRSTRPIDASGATCRRASGARAMRRRRCCTRSRRSPGGPDDEREGRRGRRRQRPRRPERRLSRSPRAAVRCSCSRRRTASAARS